MIVADVGPKLGYNTMDNGLLRLHHVKVPLHNMLMRYVHVCIYPCLYVHRMCKYPYLYGDGMCMSQHVYVCLYKAYVYVYVYVCEDWYMYLSWYVFLYWYVYVYVYVYVCVCVEMRMCMY